MEQQSVKIRIRLKPDDSLPDGGIEGESMWARPVRANDGGGTFELRNTSWHVPLAVRDVVRAELDADGFLQVTDVVCPGPFVMSWAVCRSEADAKALGDRWLDHGSNWSEGMNGVLATVWNEGVTKDHVQQVLDADLRAGFLTWTKVIEPDERVGSAQDLIEFALDEERHLPDVETSYWAPDDPFWKERGLDSPDFLAYVQTAAGRDPLIAGALERGDYDLVREMFAFMNDGPLW